MKNLGMAWLLLIGGCATTAGATVLDLILPIAANLLKKVIHERTGGEVDESSAVCFELPTEYQSDSDRVYIICSASAQEADE